MGLSQNLFSSFQNHDKKIKLLTVVILLTFPFKRSVLEYYLLICVIYIYKGYKNQYEICKLNLLFDVRH